MALEEIPDPDFSNAWNLFKRALWAKIIDRLNLWRHMRVVLGSSKRGSAKFIVTEEACVLDLSKVNFAIADTVTQRLQLIDASSGTPQSPAVRVSLGYVAGRLADPGMTDGTDSPIFVLPLAAAVALKYIYCAVTIDYNSTAANKWASTACAIGASSTAPGSLPNTATIIYVCLGSVNVYDDGAGGYGVTVNTPQSVSGDQCVAREGNASTYVDSNRLI